MERRGGKAISSPPLRERFTSLIKALASSTQEVTSKSISLNLFKSMGDALCTAFTLASNSVRLSPRGSRGQIPVSGFSSFGFLASSSGCAVLFKISPELCATRTTCSKIEDGATQSAPSRHQEVVAIKWVRARVKAT